MTKKFVIIGLILGALAIFFMHVAGVSAWNVEIDTNLTITPDIISFQTVFPQEVLFRPLNINLSNSFRQSNLLDDVEYRIVQKPKPRHEGRTCHSGNDTDNHSNSDRDNHTNVNQNTTTNHNDDHNDTNNHNDDDNCQTESDYCAQHPNDLTRCYPSLCPYLSKTPDGQPGNDIGVPAFHDPNAPSSIARGRLAKSDNDLSDSWTIDLAVPCFRGQCAQDWASFVLQHNPNAGDPAQYQLNPALVHEVFGCDLKIEVTNVSYFNFTTRTQGFWKTHTAFTSNVFATNLGGTMNVGTGGHVRTVTNTAGNGQSRLFGAWYSSIPKKTTGQNRSSLDKARIQLLRQLVTAKLNCAVFGCSSATQTLITTADTNYATGTAAQILASASALDTYNNSGDANPIPPALGSPGSATPGESSARANKVFWDAP